MLSFYWTGPQLHKHYTSRHFKLGPIRMYVMVPEIPGGGTPYVMGDTYVPRFWPPFFTLAGSSTIFLGYFSHPPTAKLSFGVQKLPIFTKIDLFGPKFNFFLDLFGSNFQRPAAHPHQFSGRVPPPGLRYDTWARFLSLARSKLRLCSANHRPGYWSNLPCDWPSTAWAYSEQETENGPWIDGPILVNM